LELAGRGTEHWARLAEEALQLHRRNPDLAASTLKKLVEGNAL
jgi:hypothetical protein